MDAVGPRAADQRLALPVHELADVADKPGEVLAVQRVEAMRVDGVGQWVLAVPTLVLGDDDGVVAERTVLVSRRAITVAEEPQDDAVDAERERLADLAHATFADTRIGVAGHAREPLFLVP